MMPLLTDMTAARRRLVDRIRKELARPIAQRAPAALATEHIGGLTKVGRDLQKYLEAAFCAGCSAANVDPGRVTRETFPKLSGIGDCGPGQIGILIRHLDARALTAVPQLRSIQMDLARKPSAIRTFLDVRNKATHSADPLPEAVRDALGGLLNFLKA